MSGIRASFEDRFPVPEGIEWRNTDYFPMQTENVHVYVALAGVAARYSAMWQAWQASRAALLKDHVPMPRQCPSWLEDSYDEAWQDDKHFIDGLSLPAYEAMLKAQEEALQQSGIGVKHG